MLAINNNLNSVKAQTNLKQQSQINFTSKKSQDDFVKTKNQTMQGKISFGKMIPQIALKLFGKDDESQLKQKFAPLVEELISLEPDEFKEVIKKADLKPDEKRFVIDEVVDQIVLNDSIRDDVQKLLELELIGELLKRRLQIRRNNQADENTLGTKFSNKVRGQLTKEQYKEVRYDLTITFATRRKDSPAIREQVVALEKCTNDPILKDECNIFIGRFDRLHDYIGEL